jgi:excisionase family DNA binding protein
MFDHTNSGEINMTDRYLTFKELMEALNVGRSSIYRRVADGTLPAPIQIGKLKRFKKSEVEAALERLGENRG